MILGIGNDITNIERIRSTYQRFGNRFVERIFTTIEQQTARRRADPVPTFAKRFAAKEACAKALGTGISRSVFFRDMGVVNLPSGQPSLILTGGALERLRQLTPPGKTAHLHLTISDEEPLAQAIVIIEAL